MHINRIKKRCFSQCRRGDIPELEIFPNTCLTFSYNNNTNTSKQISFILFLIIPVFFFFIYFVYTTFAYRINIYIFFLFKKETRSFDTCQHRQRRFSHCTGPVEFISENAYYLNFFRSVESKSKRRNNEATTGQNEIIFKTKQTKKMYILYTNKRR